MGRRARGVTSALWHVLTFTGWGVPSHLWLVAPLSVVNGALVAWLRISLETWPKDLDEKVYTRSSV